METRKITMMTISISVKRWNIEQQTGYKPKTTYYEDFGIAEPFGIKALQDTLNKAIKETQNNIVNKTELVMVLNHKIWEHYYSGHQALARWYDQQWKALHNKMCNTLKGEELSYYLQTTD